MPSWRSVPGGPSARLAGEDYRDEIPAEDVAGYLSPRALVVLELYGLCVGETVAGFGGAAELGVSLLEAEALFRAVGLDGEEDEDCRELILRGFRAIVAGRSEGSTRGAEEKRKAAEQKKG